MAKRAGKKAHFMKRARNNREAAKNASGPAKLARLQIAHGYETLAKHGSGKKRKKR